MTRHDGPDGGDFLALKTKFDRALFNGERAEIKRAKDLRELELLPGCYRLLPAGAQADDPRWARVVFLLPHARHREGGPGLGHLIFAAGVSEMRLFQMVRSEFPHDILHLRRLCRHIEPALDWRRFGPMLYYWGANAKRRIVEDYFSPRGEKAETTSMTKEAF